MRSRTDVDRVIDSIRVACLTGTPPSTSRVKRITHLNDIRLGVALTAAYQDGAITYYDRGNGRYWRPAPCPV